MTDREGRDLGWLHAFRDVTRERELDRMKDEFVSLVSHELRTPLTSIKGYVDLLIDGDAGEVTEEQKEFLDIVKSNSDRLVLLVNDMLDGVYGPGEGHAPMVYAGDPRQDVPSALRKHLTETLRDRDATIVKGWLEGIAEGGAEDLGLE